MRTQNLILSSYFDNSFNKISNLEELENYRRKLQGFIPYTASANGYSFFNNYYIEKMSQLEHKYNVLENGGIETAVEPITINKFILIIRSIKKILFGNAEKEKAN